MISTRSISLTTKRLTLLLSIPAALASILQLWLGASPLVLALAIVVAGLGLFAFALLGAFNLGAWLVLFYVSGNVLIALYAKSVLLQPIDSHLYAPVASFSVLAVSTAALVAGALIARRLNVGRPLFVRSLRPRTLAALSWGCFLLGVTSWFANEHFQQTGGSGFGGISIFRDLLLMAVIARTALLLQTSNDRQSFDLRLGIILVISVSLGLLTDSKTYAAYPVVSYFATLVFFRRRLALQQIAVLGFGAMVFVVVITPMIQAWRHLGVQQLPVTGRVSMISHGFADLVESDRLRWYADLAQVELRGGYYNYFGGQARGQVLLGRYASVQQIDPVIAETDHRGTIGGTAIWPAVTRQIPSVIYPDKPRFSDGYYILARFGLIDPSGGKFPTVPLAGQAYAGYGFIGLAVISLVVFLSVLLALKKFGWTLYRNVFAIFMFSEFIVVYAGQGDLTQYVALVVRVIPEVSLVFWVLCILPRLRLAPSAPTISRIIASPTAESLGQ